MDNYTDRWERTEKGCEQERKKLGSEERPSKMEIQMRWRFSQRDGDERSERQD